MADRVNDHAPIRIGDRLQFSLRSVFAFMLALAMLLSGAFTHPVSMGLGLVGFALFCAGLFHRGNVLMQGVFVGLGYVSVAAIFGFLLKME
jgi:hypothetical protein